MLKTALTERLGIEHPILQGGMAWVATWELVVAVSRAGALGILGAGMREIHTVREYVRLEDMLRAAELLVEIVRLHAEFGDRENNAGNRSPSRRS